MKAPYSYVPTLPVLAGLVSGIIAWFMGAGVVVIVIALALFVVLYGVKRHYLSFIALFAAVGIIMSMAHAPIELPEWLLRGTHTFEGEIVNVTESANSIRYIVDINRIDGESSADIRTRLTVTSTRSPVQAGSLISFSGKLLSTKGYSGTDLPYETDYNKYLASEGIVAYASVNTITAKAPPSAFQRGVNKLRDDMFNAIVLSPVDGRTAAFLLATILGDDTYITDSEYEQYRAIGIAHILALSGMHVGIIVSLVSVLLFPLVTVRRGRTLRSCLTLLIIWGYVVIVGYSPSIVRAAIMITVFIAARHIQRGYSTFNSLFLSVIIILCINPMWLMAPGFQLSVAAVASILAFGSIIPNKVQRHRVLYYVLNIMLIPVAAMLGTGIVSAYHFHTFAGMFLLGNIVTGLIFPWILMGGSVLAMFTACGLEFTLLGAAIDWLYGMMGWAVQHISSLSWAYAKGIFISAWVALPYTLMLIALAFALRKRSFSMWISTVILLAAVVITERLTAESLPAAELYVPHSSRTTNIIVRDGEEAWLYTTATDPESQLAQCDRRYQNYLLSRHCGDSFIPYPGDTSSTHCVMGSNYITFGDKTVIIVNTDTLTVPKQKKPTYAIVTAKADVDIPYLYGALRPDTIVIGADVHPSRRKAYLAQCSDTIPCIDLRHRGIRMVCAK